MQNSNPNTCRTRWGLLSLAGPMLAVAVWATFPARAPQADAAPPNKNQNTTTYSVQPLGIRGVYDFSETGVVAGRRGLATACLLVPEDSDGDGRPDTWFVDDGTGQNALVELLPVLDEYEVQATLYAVHSAGYAVGISSFTQDFHRAVLWQGDTMVPLGAPGPHGTPTDRGWMSAATDVNAHGQVVGWASDVHLRGEAASFYGFLINPLDGDGDGRPDTWFVDDGHGGNALMIDLQLPDPPPPTYFNFLQLNDNGRVCASRLALVIDPVDSDGDGTPDTWVRDEDGDGLNDLAVPLPAVRKNDATWASGLNQGSEIVGDSEGRAVLWQVGGEGGATVTLLPDPKAPRGWSVDRTVARGINDAGQIVGFVEFVENKTSGSPLPTIKSQPCLWQEGTVFLLNDLLTNGEFSPYSSSVAINNSGQILGWKYSDAFSAFILVPNPEL